MHRYRSHTCGALRDSHIGETVRLSGWVHRMRDHGGVLFIDLRDHYGLTQVVADPDSPAFKDAETLRAEWVIRVDGKVRRRPGGTENPDLPTGAVEVYIATLEVLGPAAELPMPVFGDQEYPEEIRLKYRFLDLRRERLHRNIMKRGQIIDSIRRRMKEQGFFEFQTPILTASSPEGARDFLVPSRLHPGKFYALPQAPQQFKQLIMIAGFDRYFQIAPCFRDEDARADRSPGEFYQLDVEMSFVTQDDVFAAVEPVMRGVFEEFADGKPVTQKFPLIPYADALRKYGTDKPDLRNPIEMQDVSEIFRGSGFKVFARILEASAKNEVWAIPAPGGGSRAFCDRMNSWAQGEGQPGLGYIFWRGGRARRSARPGRQECRAGAHRAAARAARPEGAATRCSSSPASRTTFVKFAGPARTKVGQELDLIAKDRFEFCWIVDFPMYEWNEEEKKIDFSHNPFSMPNIEPEQVPGARSERQGHAARPQGDPVRHRLQRHRAVVRRDPQPSPRRDEEGLRDRRLSGGGAGAEVRRHAARAFARRAAAWRHRARHRPHRDAAVRRGEPARGRAVPDEPARRGPADGRAVGGHAEAAARTAHPAELAGEVVQRHPGQAPKRVTRVCDALWQQRASRDPCSNQRDRLRVSWIADLPPVVRDDGLDHRPLLAST